MSTHLSRDMTRIALMTAAATGTLSAQWAHREDHPKPADRGDLVAEFSKPEWDASTFAPAREVGRFRALRYGMFIHFGVTRSARLASPQIKQTE